MQLIEVSMTGIRSAVITLRAPQTPMRIILFPMLHLGTGDYYRAVTERLAGCDLIVAEGVERTASAWALTLAYRLPARSRQLALTVQEIDYASLGAPVIRPDMTARQFRAGWRRQPVSQRLLMWCLVPLIGLAFAVLGTRRTFLKFFGTTDLPSYEEAEFRRRFPQLTRLLLDDRDEMLVECLSSLHES